MRPRSAELGLERLEERSERVRDPEPGEHQRERAQHDHPAVTLLRQRFFFFAVAGLAPSAAITSTSSSRSGCTRRSTPTSVLAGSLVGSRYRVRTWRYAFTASGFMRTM